MALFECVCSNEQQKQPKGFIYSLENILWRAEGTGLQFPFYCKQASAPNDRCDEQTAFIGLGGSLRG